MRLPGGDLAARLSDRLHALDYTVEGVRRLVGEPAANALDRDEVVAAARVLGDDLSPLATVVRTFMLAEAIPESALQRALGIAAIDLGDLVEASGGAARAVAELAPCAVDDQNWFIVSDWSSRRTGVPTAADHVLGVGGASTMLAQCTVRPDAARALDLGTGCGVQAFHLAGHADQVVATDVSQRSLEFTRFNASLNRFDLDLRRGSLFDPVRGERFDVVVSNPPFVIGSPAAGHHDYRDFAGAGDSVCERIVSDVEQYLTSGGWCQLLANWEITDADDWSWSPRTWLANSGLDGWVIQREVQDPALYVETWLRDSGEHRHPSAYAELYHAWLSALEERRAVAIGFGLVTLHRAERDSPLRRFQHVPQEWRQPVARDIERWFAVNRLLGEDPAGVLGAQLALADDVVLEQHSWNGDREALTMLRRTSGMCWSGPVDAFGLDVISLLDGTGLAAEVVLGVAAEHGIPAETALTQAVPVLGRLAEEGFVRGWVPEG